MSEDSIVAMDQNPIDQLASNLEKSGASVEVIAKTQEIVEAEAREKGWRPDGPKSAKEFLDDEPYYKELKARGREIKELKQTIDEIKAHFQVEREAGRREALEELRRQRSDAIALGDENRVNQLEDEIAKQDIPVAQEPNVLELPVVQEFAARNKEWLTDITKIEYTEMQEFFVKRDEQLKKANLPIEEHVRIIESDMHKKFPNYFSSGEGSGMVANVVDSVPSGKVATKKTFSFKDLNAEQKEVCKHFVKRGVMTEEKYIESLVKTGALKNG